MVNLHIDQKFGRIGLKIKSPEYDLKIKQPDVGIKQKPAELNIQQTRPEINIDYTPALESLGYYGLFSRVRIFKDEANSVLLSGIERRVLEGNQISRIADKISFGQIAKQAYEPIERELGLVPIQPIRITYKPSTIELDVKTGGVSIETTLGSVQGNFKYEPIEAYIEQEPYIKIYTKGSNIDVKK